MIIGILLVFALGFMMLGTHTIRLSLSGGASSILVTSGLTKYPERFGQPNTIEGVTTLTEGNGANQANQTYAGTFSIAAGATTYIDLVDGTGTPKDVLNNSLSLAKVKLIVIELDTPAGNNVLQFGPAGNASGAPLWFANNTQSAKIHDLFVQSSPIDGWTVSTGAGNLCLKNAGNATTLTGKIRVVGVKA